MDLFAGPRTAMGAPVGGGLAGKRDVMLRRRYLRGTWPCREQERNEEPFRSRKCADGVPARAFWHGYLPAVLLSESRLPGNFCGSIRVARTDDYFGNSGCKGFGIEIAAASQGAVG